MFESEAKHGTILGSNAYMAPTIAYASNGDIYYMIPNSAAPISYAIYKWTANTKTWGLLTQYTTCRYIGG